jgi:hypothetical protein
LAAPSAAVLRYDRLQLLLTMLIETGIVPTVDEYQARRAGDADAREAPAASTLIIRAASPLAVAVAVTQRVVPRSTGDSEP